MPVTYETQEVIIAVENLPKCNISYTVQYTLLAWM